jgi:hypothetical protein
MVTLKMLNELAGSCITERVNEHPIQLFGFARSGQHGQGPVHRELGRAGV